MEAAGLAFGETIRAPAFAKALARDGHVQIPNALTATTANALASLLQSETPWLRTIYTNGAGSDLPVERFDTTPREMQREFLEGIWSEASSGFQYLFDHYRFWYRNATGQPTPALYGDLVSFLNAPATLELFRTLTGDPEIVLVDGQATRYLPGHFLALHDDKHEELGRRFAYVLNLTQNWRTDWGGLLLFHDEDNRVTGLTPLYNTLNVFRVPRLHSVSMVAPYATAPRLAITGWMRARL